MCFTENLNVKPMFRSLLYFAEHHAPQSAERQLRVFQTFSFSVSVSFSSSQKSKHGKHRRRHAGATLTEGERYPDDVGLPCPPGHQKHRLPDGALCLQEAQWWLVFLSLFFTFSLLGYWYCFGLTLIISNSRVNWVSNFALHM